MAISSSFRQPSREEVNLIEHLLRSVRVGKAQLRAQLKNCLVRVLDEDGCLEFNILTDVRTTDESGLVGDGEFLDVDGKKAYVLLRVLHGQLLLLEFYKADGSRVLRIPDPSGVELYWMERKALDGHPFREMQPREKELIRKLLEPDFPGRKELLQQLETAQVRTIDNNGSLEFLITSPVKVNFVQFVVPVEGEYKDSDGTTVHVLIHILGGQAKELEFYRDDNGQVQSWPDPNTVRVFVAK